MADTNKCVCGHTQANHHGLERQCLAFSNVFSSERVVGTTQCDCPYWVPVHDPVNAPTHYTRFPDGVQPIHLARHLTYNLGSAVAYLARAGHKGDTAEDLRKAIFHIENEIERLGKAK